MVVSGVVIHKRAQRDPETDREPEEVKAEITPFDPDYEEQKVSPSKAKTRKRVQKRRKSFVTASQE